MIDPLSRFDKKIRYEWKKMPEYPRISVAWMNEKGAAKAAPSRCMRQILLLVVE
jgi:hypothetical protein